MIKKLAIAVGLMNIVAFLLVFKNPNKKQRYKKYDCAIVCGYPANRDGYPSKVMKSRIQKGVLLYKQGKVKKLILTGGAVKNEFVEAEVMKEYAKYLGVKDKDIIIEKQARSTYHNMMYCRDLMQVHHLSNALVVTNSWHLRKADHYARKFKLDYAMVESDAPESYCKLWVWYLHLHTNLTMYHNLFKGYY